jgi:hypothetical protein
MLWFNRILLPVIVNLIWEFSDLPCDCLAIGLETKFMSLNCILVSRFQQKHNFEKWAILPEQNKYNIYRNVPLILYLYSYLNFDFS